MNESGKNCIRNHSIISHENHKYATFFNTALRIEIISIIFQIWPIFAQGGEYGPKYDILDESQKRSEVNEYVDDENNLYFNPLTMTKKDLESMLHQPDPALTVQQLPQNPKISFRKGHPSEQKGNTNC